MYGCQKCTRTYTGRKYGPYMYGPYVRVVRIGLKARYTVPVSTGHVHGSTARRHGCQKMTPVFTGCGPVNTAREHGYCVPSLRCSYKCTSDLVTRLHYVPTVGMAITSCAQLPRQLHPLSGHKMATLSDNSSRRWTETLHLVQTAALNISAALRHFHTVQRHKMRRRLDTSCGVDAT